MKHWMSRETREARQENKMDRSNAGCSGTDRRGRRKLGGLRVMSAGIGKCR
jgi:hypothetical protein